MKTMTVAEALARACALHDAPHRPAAERARLRAELEAWVPPPTEWGRLASRLVHHALRS